MALSDELARRREVDCADVRRRPVRHVAAGVRRRPASWCPRACRATRRLIRAERGALVYAEVLQGLAQRDAESRTGGARRPWLRFPLAIVPAGSGNAVTCVRFGIPVDALRAVAAFVNGVYGPVDLVQCDEIGAPTSTMCARFRSLTAAAACLADQVARVCQSSPSCPSRTALSQVRRAGVSTDARRAT